MSAKAVCLMWLSLFLVLELLPVPTLTPLLLYVVFTRPIWFKSLIERLYAGT